MARYRVQYVDGYSLADGGDNEILDAAGFGLGGDGKWMDFLDTDDVVILRVRAKHVLRVELVGGPSPRPSQDNFDPEEEELAG
jgi:hypothetical protein